MGRKPIDIKIRLERQEKKILRLTKEIEEAKDEYQKLIEEQKEEDMPEITHYLTLLLSFFQKSKPNDSQTRVGPAHQSLWLRFWNAAGSP